MTGPVRSFVVRQRRKHRSAMRRIALAIDRELGTDGCTEVLRMLDPGRAPRLAAHLEQLARAAEMNDARIQRLALTIQEQLGTDGCAEVARALITERRDAQTLAVHLKRLADPMDLHPTWPHDA